jgi:phosphopantetheine binding protein
MSLPLTAREDLGLSSSYAEPEAELQIALADMWSRKLGVAPIGLHDDFFEIGGHSLLAADLQLEIYERYGVEVEAWTLFMQPTVAALAETLATHLT